MASSEAIETSKRAQASFHGGTAWTLMEKVKLRPQYDREKEPDGVINLSGASNALMKDWMDGFVRENSHNIPLENSQSTLRAARRCRLVQVG
jgi:hypothetical protein